MVNMTGENSQNSLPEDHDGRSNGTLELASENAEVPGNHSITKRDGLTTECHVDSGDFGSFSSLDSNYDQLTAVVFDLTFQNAYLKAQFDGFRDEMSSSIETFREEKEISNVMASEQVKHLQEKVKSLNNEIKEQNETQKAAENALEHLRGSYAEADARVQELSAKLIEAQQMKEHEIKERDEKYVELDTKFQRLHKRAKQRIQELQKEKDDLEVRFRDLNETVEKASSEQSSMQQELERTRQQANEALRAMDTERQQLRTTNNKLRDNIDEMHRLLETKETTLEELRQSVFEKEQILDDTKRLLQAAEERKQTSIADISSKHQKVLESLEAQLAEALLDRNKAAESISCLQVLIGEKDSKIAELEAASTGEAVRLGAAIEAAKAEAAQLKSEHEKEKEHWDAVCQTLKTKLETFESACLRSEIEAAKLRSQFESELSLQSQLLQTKDSEILVAKEEINRLESEFSSYKVRAHALLQKKEAELQAAKDTEIIKAQEEAIREAEKEMALAAAERDKILNDLETALLNHEKEISTRDAALVGAEQQNRGLASKLDSLNAQYLSEKEAWQKSADDVEEEWRLRYNTLEAQKNAESGKHLQGELQGLKMQYNKLKEEHDSFRDIADRMLEEKEKEIFKLSEEKKNLLQSLEIKPSVNHSESLNIASAKLDSSSLSIAAAEQQILLLARQQAQREEELAQSQRHILALQDEIEELEHENRLHSQQEAMLKEALREMERKQKREGVDMTYLKNVILKLLETGEVEVLLPVIAMLLQFSPEETRKCQQAYRSANDASSSPAASPADSSGLTARSLFSSFAFS